MKKMIMVLALISTAACADTGTRLKESLYGVDVAYSTAQSLAISLIDGHTLSALQVGWVKNTDKFIAAELGALNTKAENDEASITSEDVAKVKSDIKVFQAGVKELKNGY